MYVYIQYISIHVAPPCLSTLDTHIYTSTYVLHIYLYTYMYFYVRIKYAYV